MTWIQSPLLSARDGDELSRRLPKNVRLVGAAPPLGWVEFEVVVGNASYRQGEHFYLTADQAHHAYFRAPLDPA